MPSSPASSRPATELCCPYTEPRLRLDWHCLLPPGPRAQLLIPCIAPTSEHWRPPGTAGPPLNTAGAAANINPTHQQIPHKSLNRQKLNDIQAAQADLSDCRQKVQFRDDFQDIAAPPLPTAFPRPALCVQLSKVFGNIRFTLFPRFSHSFQGYAPIVDIISGLRACPAFR